MATYNSAEQVHTVEQSFVRTIAVLLQNGLRSSTGLRGSAASQRCLPPKGLFAVGT